ncbi:lanthionine synthetase C family protein [Streptomyces sp. NPDC087850]|uniref:lanthionine synthetase C family protein n=1 Tax=unclassified Streptomyces TaxID=2593676 RepID=UPI0038217A47
MTMHSETAGQIAAIVADRLASPTDAHQFGLPQGWHPQSLAYGAAGVALLHVERARAGLGPWTRARDWIACAAAGQIESWEKSHLHYGVPAVAFAMHAAADRPGQYARALAELDYNIARTTRHFLERAHVRMDTGGALPALAEFDSIRGLSGFGAYLLRYDPSQDLLCDVLAYLVRLTEPVNVRGELFPGWWSDLAPSGRSSQGYPGGHSNHGLAHGIAGPLALLALSARRGVLVSGHLEAIGRICDWFDRWRQESPAGAWWPHLITRAQYRGEQGFAEKPSRPSWCYGTAGHARSQQLAALAIGDTTRQHVAEHALKMAFTDPGHLALTVDRSICHGYAGMAHIAAQAAADAATPGIAACVPGLLREVGTAPEEVAASLLQPEGGDIGLLEGGVGVALALHSAAAGIAPVSGWDAFLLIN